MQVLPVLPVVVPVLLEALSGLEDARLNYVEQVCFVRVLGCMAIAIATVLNFMVVAGPSLHTLLYCEPLSV